MPRSKKHISLLLPGLVGPQSDHPIGDYLAERPAALDRLVSRGHMTASRGPTADDVLLDLFGVESAIAPLTWLADTGVQPAGYVMRADPVHLRADQSCLRLFQSHGFDISRAEADALVQAFNEFNADSGLTLQAPDPRRWYLHLEQAPDLQLVHPLLAAGEDINPYLPQGADARAWRVLVNEVQMLFHTHDVNVAREQRGVPMINSLWLWGGGVMPATTAATFDRVYTEDPLATALARAAGLEVQPLAAPAPGLPGRALVVADSLQWPAAYNDIEHWLVRLQALEQELFAPLLAALRHGQLDTLTLLPCNGRACTVTRARLRAFWRGVRAYESVLAA